MPDEIARTPQPPYYAAIFSSLRTQGDAGYEATAQRMIALASQQPGFLGVESVRGDSGLGVTVSYWRDLKAISEWKRQSEHLDAQNSGREKWYSHFTVRIAKVEREYSL